MQNFSLLTSPIHSVRPKVDVLFSQALFLPIRLCHFPTGCPWARTLNRKKSDIQTIPGHCLHEEAEEISTLLARSTRVSRMVTRQGGLGHVTRKSRNFSGAFRVTYFSLYLQNEGVSRHVTLQLF